MGFVFAFLHIVSLAASMTVDHGDDDGDRKWYKCSSVAKNFASRPNMVFREWSLVECIDKKNRSKWILWFVSVWHVASRRREIAKSKSNLSTPVSRMQRCTWECKQCEICALNCYAAEFRSNGAFGIAEGQTDTAADFAHIIRRTLYFSSIILFVNLTWLRFDLSRIRRQLFIYVPCARAHCRIVLWQLIHQSTRIVSMKFIEIIELVIFGEANRPNHWWRRQRRRRMYSPNLSTLIQLRMRCVGLTRHTHASNLYLIP